MRSLAPVRRGERARYSARQHTAGVAGGLRTRCEAEAMDEGADGTGTEQEGQGRGRLGAFWWSNVYGRAARVKMWGESVAGTG